MLPLFSTTPGPISIKVDVDDARDAIALELTYQPPTGSEITAFSDSGSGTKTVKSLELASLPSGLTLNTRSQPRFNFVCPKHTTTQNSTMDSFISAVAQLKASEDTNDDVLYVNIP